MVAILLRFSTNSYPLGIFANQPLAAGTSSYPKGSYFSKSVLGESKVRDNAKDPNITDPDVLMRVKNEWWTWANRDSTQSDKEAVGLVPISVL
jgi:hypothetical protein